MLKKKFHGKAYYPNPNAKNEALETEAALPHDSSETEEFFEKPEVNLFLLTEPTFEQQQHQKLGLSFQRWIWLAACLGLTLLIAGIVFALVFGLGNASDAKANTATPTTIIFQSNSLFLQRQVKVHGNLNNFFYNQTSFVISPFGIDYILSFIGNVGDPKEKAVINEYFGIEKNNNLSEIYAYYNLRKYYLFSTKKGTKNFIISNFVTGNKTGEFMHEQTKLDDVTVYPASDRSYSHYFNDMFRKRLNDENAKYFSYKNFSTPENTVIGFNFIKMELQFKNVGSGLIKTQLFLGNKHEKYVNYFSTFSKSADFENYRLHAISFKNTDFDLFIIENLSSYKTNNFDGHFIQKYKKSPIPFVNSPSQMLKNLRQLKSSNVTNKSIYVPEIHQQTTIDVAPYFKDILNHTLAIYSPFNTTNIGKDKYDLNKFYQALRFDLSCEGVNVIQSKRYETITSINGHGINNPLIYGVAYKTEMLIYYGVYA